MNVLSIWAVGCGYLHHLDCKQTLD